MKRLRVYLLLVGLSAALTLPLPFVFRDEWECNEGETCRTSFADGLVTTLYAVLFVGALCALAEAGWRYRERRRRRRYGDLRPFEPPRAATRIAGYVVGLPAIVFLGAAIGSGTYDCPPDATDCDLGVLNALAGALVAFGLGVALVFAAEVAIAIRRRTTR